MAPEEIQTIVSGIGGPPWWSYLGMFICASVGAGVGAYLKKKFENMALEEDFRKLRAQLKQTTQDAEDIKQALAGKGWLRQQQWNRREKHYLRLLHELSELEHWASTLANILQHEKYVSSDKNHVEAAREFEASKGGLRKELSTADLFVNEEALATVKGLLSQGRSFTDGIGDEEDGWGIYLGRWSKAAQKARVVVLRHAQDELNGID